MALCLAECWRSYNLKFWRCIEARGSTKRLLPVLFITPALLAFRVIEQDACMFARGHMTSCLFIYLVSNCWLQFIWPIKNYKTYFMYLSNTLPSLPMLPLSGKLSLFSFFTQEEYLWSWVPSCYTHCLWSAVRILCLGLEAELDM